MGVLPFDETLFDVLVCPLSRAPLKFVDGWLVSTDAASRRRYPVEDGLPILLPEEAEVLDEDAWRAAMAADGPVSADGAGNRPGEPA